MPDTIRGHPEREVFLKKTRTLQTRETGTPEKSIERPLPLSFGIRPRINKP